MFYYILFWVSVVGLCLGSFYNVVILRSLSNESIVFPASKCPICNTPLKWWHNIPVLSYILLKGKCYFCKAKISIQYPIIELLTMLLFIACFLKFGFAYNTLFSMFFVSCLIIMTMTDLKEKIVDCRIAIAMGIVGIFYYYFNTGVILNSIYGMLVAVVLIELIARLGYLSPAKTRAMGEADTYVAGAFGLMFGIENVLYVLMYALIASMLLIIPRFLYKQFKNNNKCICILFLLFLLTSFVFNFVNKNYLLLLAVIVLGVFLAISILKSMKNNQESLDYIPYVPALSVGALYFLFV